MRQQTPLQQDGRVPLDPYRMPSSHHRMKMADVLCCAKLCHAHVVPCHPLQTEPVSEAKLKAAAGLAQLDARRYKAAARAFVSVSPELGTNYSEVRHQAHSAHSA